jgi:hypothetical protein
MLDYWNGTTGTFKNSLDKLRLTIGGKMFQNGSSFTVACLELIFNSGI